MSTLVYQQQSFHSSHLPPPPIPATNRNSAFQFGLDRCEFPGLYKPAFLDPRQDLNTTPSRVNNSGSGFSSLSLLQPCNKPFSYTRGWGSYQREAWSCVPADSARPTPWYTSRNRSRPTRRCSRRSSSSAAYSRGDWWCQSPPTSVIAQETRVTKAVTQTLSQSLDWCVSAAQALAAPRTLVWVKEHHLV